MKFNDIFIRVEKHKIRVPFCLESALSGVMTTIQQNDFLVYSRSFHINPSWKEKRIKLIFEAVDYETKVIVNGVKVGRHRGGYDSFSFDITEYLRDFKYAQNVIVMVKDPTESEVFSKKNFLKT